MRNPKHDVLFEPVVIYDDDHHYMGGVLAELLRSRNHGTQQDSELQKLATVRRDGVPRTNQLRRVQFGFRRDVRYSEPHQYSIGWIETEQARHRNSFGFG